MSIVLMSLFLAAPELTIDRVVVFADRAEVRRSGEVSCPGGDAALTVTGLPAGLDPRTLKVEAGAAKAVLARVRSEDLTAAADPIVAELDKSLASIRHQIGLVEGERRIALERNANAHAYGEFWRSVLSEELRAPKASPDAWRKVLATLEGEDLAVGEKTVDLDAKLRGLRREEQALEARRGVFGAETRRVIAVDVVVDCVKAASAKVSLSYGVGGASWRPEYDVRFRADGGKKVGKGELELGIGAIVEQATGEDWKDVELVFSTAAARLGGEAPLPATLHVAGGPASEQKVLVEGEEDRSSLPESAPAGPRAAAGVEDQGRAFTLTLPHKATLVADGRAYWFPVDAVKGPGQAKLVAVPRLARHVYQALEAKNPASHPLLPGPAHAHRGGSYVGDDAIPYRGPGEPIEVSLGFDDEVAVERVDVGSKDVAPGVLSGRTFERVYRIKLTNRSSEKQVVELRENIPVSQEEELEVVLDKQKTTPGHLLDAKRGILTWSVELERGAERSIDLRYEVHLPKSWMVQ